MKNIIQVTLFYFYIYFVSCFTIWADEIITKDGSRIIGNLVLFEDGNLTFQTEFAGKIKISTSQISSLLTDNSISVRLEDNRTFESKILLADESKILIEENQLRPSFEDVRHLWPTENEDPLVIEMKKKAKLLVMSWKNSLGFDFMGASGNTQTFGIGARLDSDYGNKIRNYDFYLSYNNTTKKDQKIVDETKLGLEYDSRFFEQLSWYSKTDLENDKLEEIDIRATSALGLKYSWIENTRYKLAVRSGLAFRFEEYGLSNAENVDALAMDFGLEYSHKIKNLLSLQSDITFIPSLEKFSDFLISKDTALVIPLDKESNWNLRAGLDGTYNSTPVKNKEELDLKYYMRIVYRLN
jgi:putative salt-induced outer membrane protein YdiY